MKKTVRYLLLLLSLLIALPAMADAPSGGLTFYGGTGGVATDLTRTQAVELMREKWGAQVLGRVTVDDVPTIIYVRSEPDKDSVKIGGLPGKTILDLVGRTENGWNIVVLPTGYYGYVSSKITNYLPGETSKYSYSYPIGSATFHGDCDRKYYGYCSTSQQDAKTLIATYYGGDVVTVVGFSDGYYCVLNLSDGYMCYVSKYHVDVVFTADTEVTDAQAGALTDC